MTIANKKVVSIHYVLKNDDGEVMDSSEGRSPLTYLHGYKNIIPGLEAQLEGKDVGDAFEARIEAKDGYGDFDERMVHTVKREQLQGMESLEVGMMFTSENEQGQAHFTVTEIEGDDITVDGNHPMAGKNLNFTGSVESLRDASEEEIAHGHVHGPEGHDH